MSSDFITNNEQFMDKILNEIIPNCKSLNFLVGYFYFSGFDLISEIVKDKDIKILVGMDIDTDFKNRVIEYNFISEEQKISDLVKEQKSFCNNIQQIYNDDEFDKKENIDSFKLFIKKLENGTLEIRKTKRSNHAKVYLFERDDDKTEGGSYPGSVITGSSNFTFSGFKGRDEVNVISRSSDDFNKMIEYFNNLWNNDSIPLFNKDNYDFFKDEVVDKIAALKTPSPYWLYIKALYEYFSIRTDNVKLPEQITSERFTNFSYQSDAIKQAIDIINRHNGVIVADVVGLGKSIIASAVAHNFNYQTIVIAPPHLTPQWEEYSRYFNFNASVYSSGMIEHANEDFQSIDRDLLVIVDEAHKYRNELSATYGELWKLCQGNKVILLSATPFNNKPEDVFSLMKLFQVPSRSTLHTVDNLYQALESIIHEYKDIKKTQKKENANMKALEERIKEISFKIRKIIEPVVVRRTRLDLENIEEYKSDLDNQGISFSKVNDPELLEYNLGKYSDLYKETINMLVKNIPTDEDSDNDEKEEDKTKTISALKTSENDLSGLTCASFKPVIYISKNHKKYEEKIQEMFGDKNLFNRSQKHLAVFIRRLLVRRFESSIAAFKSTLENILEDVKDKKRYANKYKFIPVYQKKKKRNVLKIESDLHDFFMDDDEISLFYQLDIEEHIKKMEEEGMLKIDIKDLSKDFMKELDNDIQILETIHQKWFGNQGKNPDPKLNVFKKIIKDMRENDPNRKIIVFSEYKDTVNYLFEQLNKESELKVFKYSSAEATDFNKNEIRKNFDAMYENQADDFDILIATDAISEGYNLNRAGTIINYDIPYNPTRVIQRVGRINRVNKKVFEELYLYNFFPSDIGEDITRTKSISTLKISLIQAIFGGDTKTLTSDEQLKEYLTGQYFKKDEEDLSWDVRYKNKLNWIKKEHPDLLNEIVNLPPRLRIQRKSPDDEKMIVFAKKGDEIVFKKLTDQVETLSFEDGIAFFEAVPKEKSYEVSGNYYEKFDKIKNSLFKPKTKVSKDRGIQETTLKLRALEKKYPVYRSYFSDVLEIIREFDALPDYFAKYIRNMNVDEKGISKLFDILPHRVIKKIQSQVDTINNLKETVIMCEEFINDK